MTQNTKFLIEETVALSEKKDVVRFLTYIEMLEKESKVEQHLILKSFKTALPNIFHSTINMYKNDEIGVSNYIKILSSIIDLEENKEDIKEYIEYFLKLLPEDKVLEAKSSPFLFRDLKPKTLKEIEDAIKFYADDKGQIRKVSPNYISIYMDEDCLNIDYKDKTACRLIKYNKDNGYFEGLNEFPCGFLLFNTKSNAKYYNRTLKVA